jgi:hypothetical protein
MKFGEIGILMYSLRKRLNETIELFSFCKLMSLFEIRIFQNANKHLLFIYLFIIHSLGGTIFKYFNYEKKSRL